MPAYLPSFNILCDIWTVGKYPDVDAPTYVDVPCQLYVNSKGLLDIEPDDQWAWVPPIWVRMPLSHFTQWGVATIFSAPKGLSEFYKARWKNRMHAGFPNEYLVAVVEQCDGMGVSTYRDVNWPP